ncbi:C40 family peptidase [Acidocella aminolytica]|uniref:Peptidoglycan peptidase n=1 Tax=Acidocella aminolytica 101 = DSM 11237 TaxID=1120923 RepID=A0A0D6PDU0_9PROT|nr:hypothetical protein [Acidocella aminolytica]GAN79827.1 hypothetical protein Aam_030_060 [Acidocella aminolytica 101 = DSM 11237]SHF36135.1 hypothetical protein SAMN02746095_02973 [Acidocella aminolytica 101 = DSM 11237]
MLKLFFSEGSGIGGAIVRTATWSWCAHTGFLLKNGNILDAHPTYGVSERKADFTGRVEYFALPQISSTRAALILRCAREEIGKPYDWGGIVNFGLHRNWRSKDAWFCSEFVAWAMARAGTPLLRTDHVNRVTPRDLLLSPHLCSSSW